MKLTEEIVERVRDLSLRDYIGDIPKNNKVICPKCNSGLGENKTPALHIYKNSGYCFSCNTSFDIIHYVMYSEGLHYWKTIELLASMYGISTEELGEIYYVEDKTFFNKKNACKYERELEIKEIVENEIADRLVVDRTIDKFMLIGLRSSAQELVDVHIKEIRTWNRRYGRLV